MNVGLDLQPTVGMPTGIGEYARGLARAFDALRFSYTALRDERSDLWRFDRRVLWDQLRLPLAARRARVDLLHCTSGTMPLIGSMPIVVTVHDVAWLRVQQHARAYARAYYGPLAARRYRTARRIIVVSAFSRNELLAVVPGIEPARVDVVHPGVAEDLIALDRRPDDRPFILAVGTVEQRKNLAVAIRALRVLPGVELIAVGPATPYRDACERIARELGIDQRVRFCGYIGRAELRDLYARAAVAIVPSKYEGFGFAAAQALCAGVPLIVSTSASLPEVVDGQATLVGPDDDDGWSAALATILGDRTAANRRAAAARIAAAQRFSWEAAARATLEVYGKA
ncbi:MAG: glycosyltransferase family 4 protein [Vulcanimicrobiaceae bacterium]